MCRTQVVLRPLIKVHNIRPKINSSSIKDGFPNLFRVLTTAVTEANPLGDKKEQVILECTKISQNKDSGHGAIYESSVEKKNSEEEHRKDFLDLKSQEDTVKKPTAKATEHSSSLSEKIISTGRSSSVKKKKKKSLSPLPKPRPEKLLRLATKLVSPNLQ